MKYLTHNEKGHISVTYALCGQSFSSFSTSGRQNSSSALSTHSCPEAVNLGTGTLIRLICHFHGKAPPFL